MKVILLLSSILFFAACVSIEPANQEASITSEAPVAQRPTLVGEKKKSAQNFKTPVQGKFLDYIYKIQPDHKQPEYSISTRDLNKGYATGSGPYDGWAIEFFLFRGNQKDLVFKQTTGYEVSSAEQPYGARLNVYEFNKNEMKEKQLSDVWPLAAIDSLFKKQIKAIQIKKGINVEGWAFHKLIVLPKEGTTILIKVCDKSPEPPFSTETECLHIGDITWNKQKFSLKSENQFKESAEII